MASERIDFVFLNEEEMIEAGVLNMQECIDEMDEVLQLLSHGDYVMGGKLGNSHGMLLTFPDEPAHEGMPENGPDRRFCAMPAYLGGKYQVAGCKWYGSNVDNIEKGLPRSILMFTLNDKVTGAPLAHMSANLLSAWRTSAIPGVGVRYLAKKDAKEIGLLGAGAIGSSTAEAILLEAKSAERVKIYDANEKTALQLKEKLQSQFPHLTIKVVDSTQEAVQESDIINLATAGSANPKIEKDWMKPGLLITASSSGEFDPDHTIDNIKLIVDNWGMYEETVNEDTYPYNKVEIGVLGRMFLDWIKEGRMTEDIITNIGSVIMEEQPGRESEDDIIIFALGGQPVYDVAWGHHIYQNALEKGIGTQLNLWEKAYQARES